MWGRFTVAPDMDEVPGAYSHTRYSVSGSRFMRVNINKTEKWAKVRTHDLSHWSTLTRNWTEVERNRCGVGLLKRFWNYLRVCGIFAMR